MKKTKLLSAIGGLLVASLMLSTTGYAKNIQRNSEAGKKPLSQFDQPQTHHERQKMQLSKHKEAAKRLKAKFTELRKQDINRQVRENGRTKGGK